MGYAQPLRSFLQTLTFFKKANRPRRFWVWFFLFYRKDRYSSTSSLMAGFSFYHKDREGFGKEHKVLFADSPEGTFLTKALKARLITAMGATHGIEVQHNSPSRLQTPSGNKRQMREYGDE